MSFTITIQCPIHPAYTARISPATRCKACALMFSVRNETNKALSTPTEERTELNEIIVANVV